MEAFKRLTAIAAPMVRTNIDTDAIYPVNVPAGIDPDATRFGERLFGVHRYLKDASPNPDFVLNRPEFAQARILVGGVNFGCGSSRETAVWALYEYGFRCVLAPSFSDIFAQNAAQNGLLAARLPEEVIVAIGRQLDEAPGSELTVNLAELIVVAPDGTRYPFEIQDTRRKALLTGVSDIDILHRAIPDIEAYEREMAVATPWVYAPRDAAEVAA